MRSPTGWPRAAVLTQNREVPRDPMVIRRAGPEESASIQAIEVAAGLQFAEVGLARVAEDPPMALDRIEQLCRDGRAWVAADGVDRPRAFLLETRVDGGVHVAELSVHPAVARRRIGRSLLDHVAASAADDGLVSVTLTTFTEVPWNAPYYQRCGFRILADHETGPELAELLGTERRRGTAPRVAMLRQC